MDSLMALADPNRRQIVEMLGRGALASGEIAASFAMTAPVPASEGAARGAAGGCTGGSAAAHLTSSLGLAEIDDWLARVRRFWSEPSAS
jgi:hypothetical protein